MLATSKFEVGWPFIRNSKIVNDSSIELYSKFVLSNCTVFGPYIEMGRKMKWACDRPLF